MYTHYHATSKLLHGSLSPIMGTRLDVLLFGNEPALLNDRWQYIGEQVQHLHRLLNRFDTRSEVSQLTCGLLQPAETSTEMQTILHDAQRYNELTEGLFSVQIANQPYDFGGYAKGYALRIIAEILDEASIRQALINFGNSSILAVGTHPLGDCWQVGVTHPFSGKEIAGFKLNNTSLSVSGNTPAHPAHILHPHSGLYCEGRQVVMVVADDPVDAEVLSTTLMLATEQERQRILPQFNIQQYQLYHDPD